MLMINLSNICRFDDSYSLHRRIALQEYLRIVSKIPYVRHRFRCFDEFVECPVEKDEVPEETINQPAEGKSFYRIL